MTNDINIGDKVRSFDFAAHRDIEGPDACFVEGIVEGFEGNHLVIKVTREVFEGENLEVIGGRKVRAPLNGLRTSRGRITDGVVKIEEPKPANPISDMDLSNLTEDQLDAIRTLALAAEEHFDRLGSASEFAPKADRANRASLQAFKLIGRIREEKETRTVAA
tara:strand:- start:953 stop:1441 length:489 start_codon:yes stop_codon:yes gene_type:complete